MLPPIIGNINAELLVRAISWTLFHSLWQGLVCSFLAALILILTRKTRPQVRYILLTAVFFLFLLLNGLTLAMEMHSADFPASIKNAGDSFVKSSEYRNGTIGHANPLVIDGHDYVERFSQFMNDHSSVLVIGWFLIFCFQFMRLLAGVGYVNRIRRQKLYKPGINWVRRIGELADSMGIRGKIELMESELVRIPAVTGFFKPIILVPMQMMLQLPAEDVEAIILHELAHIRRKDFLVNMVQRLARLFYFFNPGLLWISSLVSDERENCCDELAIEILGNKKAYISALLSFEEMGRRPSALALAFPGRKNQLLLRVRRILYHQNQTLNTMEKMILIACLLLFCLGPFAFSKSKTEAGTTSPNAEQQISPVKSTNPAPPAVSIEPTPSRSQVLPVVDTLPKGDKSKKATITITQDDDKTYVTDGYTIITKGDHQIVAVYYKGKKLSKEEISKMNPEIKNIMKKQDLDWSKLQKETTLSDKYYKELLSENKVHEALEAMSNLKDQKELAEVLARDAAKKIFTQSEQLSIIDQKMAQALSLDAAKMNLDQIDQTNAINKEMAELQNKMTELQAEKIKQDLENRQAIWEKLYREQSSMVPSRNTYPIGEIIKMLMDKKIIDNSAELSFELNNNIFTVNNVKQPAAVHEEFKKAFLRSSQDHVIYSASKNSTRSDVSIKD
jgi:beta-lactamase regulating signal transducer with metallopeptidase domain